METISKANLAKHWKISSTTVDCNIKKRNICLDNGFISAQEVIRQEALIKSGEYLSYTSFIKSMENHTGSLDPNAVSNYLTMQTTFIKKWIAGKYRISKTDVIKVLKHFINDGNEEATYKSLLYRGV